MISFAEVALVNKKVSTGGGINLAMQKICSFDITPGPLGIGPTSPRAETPSSIAVFASSAFDMQQIFTLGFKLLCFKNDQ